MIRHLREKSAIQLIQQTSLEYLFNYCKSFLLVSPRDRKMECLVGS